MEEPTATAGPRELLLVENDTRILELLVWFLQRKGYAVRTAASFGEARAALEARRPDLVISDFQVGDEVGSRELAHLAALRLLPPTIVVSGYLDDALEAELGRLPNVVGTLRKPFRFEDLERCMEAALGASALAGD